MSLLINCTQDSNAARASAFLSVHFCQRRCQPSVRARFAGVSVMAGLSWFSRCKQRWNRGAASVGHPLHKCGVYKEHWHFERPYRGFDRALFLGVVKASEQVSTTISNIVSTLLSASGPHISATLKAPAIGRCGGASVPSHTGRAFDCHPTSICDPDPSDHHGPAASSHGLRLCRREPVTHKIEQFRRESCKEQWIDAAASSSIGKHFQRAAFSTDHCAAHDTSVGSEVSSG